MKKWCLLFCLLISFGNSIAQTKEVRNKQFNTGKEGLALQGYDPVAYFTNNSATKGNSTFQTTISGVVYYFSSQQNKQLFDEQPKKYEPQYGGWCAYAMGIDGSKVSIDPKTFKIINGKLYLFYNQKGNNTLLDWNKNETKLQLKADEFWKKRSGL